MQPGDLPVTAAISATVHGRYAEDQAVYAERLALYPAGCAVYLRDDAIVGFLVSHPWRRDAPPALGALLGAIPADADTYYFHDIAILPGARGSGAGREAVALVARQARIAGQDEITLIAVSSADRYWTRHGFTRVAGRDEPYGPGTCVMHRIVRPA